ncbi:TraI/MobA(P) family conjugative relaxase [Caenispirillum bisanense]|uniref:Relaxase/Mobilisation nuclease domain-containing protein n=1 Tax=Caenispirillum bisanense TaxID=414052 RepID=A0A286GSR0_9PROT|nr:TraI/MobA(P) family conjugative relaxase [Caenispirillum bisanense]SOD98550.1 Relaxase/Mobilisation nuclease domain-containing protein [Caenispirillum bisanense]
MIAKKIARRPEVADDFTHLAEYIAAAREEGEKLDRFWIANCDAGTELADLDAALAEIEAVRHLSAPAGDKTYHLVVSVRPDDRERLDGTALKDIAATFADALGFAEHQYVAGSHINTDNFHLHIAFNRVHPQTLKLHAPFKDFKALEKASRALEKKYGLAIDRGMSDPKPEATLSPGARDFEANTWQQSFQRHVLEHRDEILDELKTATDWQDVHSVLARYNIRLKPHGAGLVLTDPTGRQTMKASALHRSCGKTALERRFGRFQAARFADQSTGGDRPANDEPPPAAPANDGAPDAPPAPDTAQPTLPPAPPVSITHVAGAPEPPRDGLNLPPLPTPRPVARYTPRPLLRRPGIAPLWRAYLAQRGRKRPTLVGKVARNWKAFLMMEAYDDPFAFVVLMAHQEALAVLLGEAEPAPPKPVSPEISSILARWRAAGRWQDAPASPWLKERTRVSADTRIDEAGNLVIPFREASGLLQGLRLLDGAGQQLDIGAVGGATMHVIDPRRQIGPGAAIVVTTDYEAAVAIRRATRAPVVVAPSEADLPAVIAALDRQHGGIRPILAATSPKVTVPVSCPRILLPEKRPGHVLRSLFAAELGDLAIAAWDATTDWATPKTSLWLKDRGVPGFGVRSTTDGSIAVPLRTLAGRIEDVLLIDQAGAGRRIVGADAPKPLVHVIDPRNRLGSGPVVITTGYAEAAALHRATAAPVVTAADAADWPAIAKALKDKHPEARIVLALPPAHAAAAAEPAAELGLTVVAEDLANRTRPEHAKDLRRLFASSLDDQVFLRWDAARPATRDDIATYPWLAAGRIIAAARIDDAGDILLPLRDADLRHAGLLVVDAEGRERWRLDDLPADAAKSLIHVLGGWLGGKDGGPLVVADSLPTALALHRETKAPVVQAAGDLSATVDALRKRFPERRVLVAAAASAPLPAAVKAVTLALPARADNSDHRRQVQVAVTAAGLEPRGLQNGRAKGAGLD